MLEIGGNDIWPRRYDAGSLTDFYKTQAGNRYFGSTLYGLVEDRSAERMPILDKLRAVHDLFFLNHRDPKGTMVWRWFERIFLDQTIKPFIGAAASEPGKTSRPKRAGDPPSRSAATPLMTARISVVAARSRPSRNWFCLRPGQSAITRPPRTAPPARNMIVPVP
jgi:hypothetical protein